MMFTSTWLPGARSNADVLQMYLIVKNRPHMHARRGDLATMEKSFLARHSTTMWAKDVNVYIEDKTSKVASIACWICIM